MTERLRSAISTRRNRTAPEHCSRSRAHPTSARSPPWFPTTDASWPIVPFITGRDAIRIVSTGNWALVREITLQPPADINISGISFRGDDQGLYVSVQASGV